MPDTHCIVLPCNAVPGSDGPSRKPDFCFNGGVWLLKRAWIRGGEKQRLVSTVPFSYIIIHDAVNRENMQVYALWLLYTSSCSLCGSISLKTVA